MAKKREHDLLFDYPDDDFEDPDIPKGVFSPSQLDAYRRCPRQYQYRYVKGLIKPPGVSLATGKALHFGAEVTHRNTIEFGEPLGFEEATTAVADKFDYESEAVEDWEDGDKGVIKDTTLHNFSIYYRDAVPLIKPVKVEHPFAQRFGTVPVRGVIDLVDDIVDPAFDIVDPDEPPPRIEVVADLKTTTKVWPDIKVEQAPQLTFYAEVMKSPRVRVDMLVNQKSGPKYVPKRAVRTPLQIKQLVEDVEEVVDLIKKGIFPRTDPTNWTCTPKWCGYYDICRGAKSCR